MHLLFTAKLSILDIGGSPGYATAAIVVMFTLDRIDFITVWKSYQIGFLFTQQHKVASSFSFRIATITERSQK